MTLNRRRMTCVPARAPGANACVSAHLACLGCARHRCLRARGHPLACGHDAVRYRGTHRTAHHRALAQRQELTGLVRDSSDGLLVFGEPSGREFFDTAIPIDVIEAIWVRP